jgi:ABC-2 type transport system permease protein
MLVGTAVGAAVYLLLVIAVYPSFRHDTSLQSMVEGNPAAAAAFGISGSITSPAGWLDANMYANLGPLLALMLTIGYGSTAIAGQAADGLLGLVATLPLRRAAVVRQKSVALLLVALVVPVVSLATCLTGPQFELEPSWSALLQVTATSTLLALDFGAVALLVGALTGSRGTALGVASGLAALAYLVSSLAPVVDGARSVRWASPFYWAVGNDQLAEGWSLPAVLALIGLAAVLLAATVPAFRRLDVP